MTTPFDRARALQQSAAADGFDWQAVEGLWEKLDEEVAELRAARDNGERREELGDLLFMLVNLSRHLGLDCADALSAACDKFARRYAHIQALADELPALGDPARLAAMERLWIEAKQLERAAAASDPANL